MFQPQMLQRPPASLRLLPVRFRRRGNAALLDWVRQLRVAPHNAGTLMK